VLVRSLGGGDFRLPHTGLTLYGEGVDKVPQLQLPQRMQICWRDCQNKDRDDATHSYAENSSSDKQLQRNRGLEGVGTPEEVVLVSGHLDSWILGQVRSTMAPGRYFNADDPFVAVTEHPSKRTIRFVAWMNEEFGVSGATTYLQEHSSELTYHIAALESDLGCDHPTGLSFFGAPEAARYLAPVTNALAPIGASVLTRSDEVPPRISPVWSSSAFPVSVPRRIRVLL